ncbi:MAG: hypothetical protein ABSG38_16315 [Spirochaetia bacterium]
MSTTRTTIEGGNAPGAAPSRVPYTVIGGPRWDRIRKYPYGMTLLVLSRGDRLFRANLLSDLLSRRIGEVVWVEGHEPSADVETLAREHPDVRFLLVKEPTTEGERINIGIAEARSPFVMCFWSDMRLARVAGGVPESMEKSGSICVVPLSRNARLQPIPSWQSPVWKRRRLSVAFRIPRREGELTLFPFDYCGLYSTERFLRTGGFDPSISNPYWQKLDFGFRCFLWGERITGSTEVTVTYTAAPPTDDSTPDQGYKLFFLKNLAVRMRREMGVLPVRCVVDYLIHSDASPLYSLREFGAVRDWVRTHRFRFRRDPRDLIQRWEGV